MQAVGTEQIWSSDTYEKQARWVSVLGAGVLGWLDPQPGERILDIGCGDGYLTAELVKAGASVVGVDSSEDFIRAARERGLDARLQSAEKLAFENEFDAVFSNAALHWMLDADAVIEGVHRALKPGGRFVAEFGGHGNVAAIVTALTALGRRHGVDPFLAKPWFFPTPTQYARMLEAHGFTVDRMELIHRPTPLPNGMRAWVATFRKPFFDAIGEEKDAALDELEATLAPALRDADGGWTADYVRLRFVAHRD